MSFLDSIGDYTDDDGNIIVCNSLIILITKNKSNVICIAMQNVLNVCT